MLCCLMIPSYSSLFFELQMKTPLTKALTPHQAQAYEGANDFYRYFIPAVMMVAITANLISSHAKKDEKKWEQLKEILTQGIVTVVSYAIALKFYKLCNRIDTTPIFQLDISEQISQRLVNQDQSDHLLGGAKPNKFYCSVCKVLCDYRTRHCRKCNTCIQRYDHHCFWIGNCVGRHNHRQFYFFLLAQTINNITLFLLISRLESLAGWQIWLQWAGELMGLGFCCFTGYLLLYHTMLVSCGITTWQHMRRTKISYLKYLPLGINPFSKGILQNWRIFLTEQTRANGSQIVQSWQQEIILFEDAKTMKAGCNIIENEYYSCC